MKYEFQISNLFDSGKVRTLEVDLTHASNTSLGRELRTGE